jgi:hypothetical protein
MHNPDGTTAVLDETLLQYRCELPAGAHAVVQRGTRVDTDDVLATYHQPGNIYVLDVAAQLGIAPQRIGRALRAVVGQRLAGGEVLARGPGLFQRLLMPTAGTISAVDESTGCVVYRSDGRQETLRAHVRGVVMQVDDRSVVIEAPAAQLTPACAFIRADRGVLRVMSDQPHHPIRADDIDERAFGALLIGGTIERAAIERAAQVGAAGIIVGGLAAADLAGVLGLHGYGAWPQLLSVGHSILSRPLPLTIMITEGFGAHGMHPTAFALLSRYDRQPALIERRSVSHERQASRLLIALNGERPITLHAGHPRLRVGAQVRLLCAPFFGHSGIVRQLEANGRAAGGLLRCATAEIATQDGRQLTLPTSLLEPLG